MHFIQNISMTSDFERKFINQFMLIMCITLESLKVPISNYVASDLEFTSCCETQESADAHIERHYEVFL